MEEDGELITVPKQVVSLSELKASYPNGYDGIDWWNCDSIKNRHKVTHGHGTVVYFLGNSRDQDTWAIDSRGVLSKRSDRAYSEYIASRYWELDVKVSCNLKQTTNAATAHSFHSLRVKSMHEVTAHMRYKFINSIDCGEGFSVRVFMREEALSVKDKVTLADYTLTSKHSNGFVAIKYKNELYNHEWGKSIMRKWGVIADEIMSQVKLIIIPPCV
jgi:hypothetical protein